MVMLKRHLVFISRASQRCLQLADKSVFGGEFTKVIRFKEIVSPEFSVAEKEENKIMLIALPIGMFRDKYGIEWIIEFSPSK